MKLTTATAILQCAATLTLGLMAGFFFAFAIDVAPAMRALDANAYIATQQSINAAVRNVPFALAYFGSAILPFIAALLSWLSGQKRIAAAWLAIAVLYLLGVFVLTREVNIPINSALALWNPLAPPEHWQQARDDWNAANLVRCIVACLGFAAALALPRTRS